MKPSDVDQLSDDEVLTMAVLLGAEFIAAEPDSWYVDMPDYPYALGAWHPIEDARRFEDNFHGFRSHSEIARAYVKWALTSRVTA